MDRVRFIKKKWGKGVVPHKKKACIGCYGSVCVHGGRVISFLKSGSGKWIKGGLPSTVSRVGE